VLSLIAIIASCTKLASSCCSWNKKNWASKWRMKFITELATELASSFQNKKAYRYHSNTRKILLGVFKKHKLWWSTGSETNTLGKTQDAICY